MEKWGFEMKSDPLFYLKMEKNFEKRLDKSPSEMYNI